MDTPASPIPPHVGDVYRHLDMDTHYMITGSMEVIDEYDHVSDGWWMVCLDTDADIWEYGCFLEDELIYERVA